MQLLTWEDADNPVGSGADVIIGESEAGPIFFDEEEDLDAVFDSACAPLFDTAEATSGE